MSQEMKPEALTFLWGPRCPAPPPPPQKALMVKRRKAGAETGDRTSPAVLKSYTGLQGNQDGGNAPRIA